MTHNGHIGIRSILEVSMESKAFFLKFVRLNVVLNISIEKFNPSYKLDDNFQVTV